MQSETMTRFVKRLGIKGTFERIDTRPDGLMAESSRHYKVTLRIQDGALSPKPMVLYFSQGSACDEPTVEDVISCIQSDATHGATFEEWCSDFGYDTDSRQAMAIFQACVDQERRAERFLGNQYGRLLWSVEPL